MSCYRAIAVLFTSCRRLVTSRATASMSSGWSRRLSPSPGFIPGGRSCGFVPGRGGRREVRSSPGLVLGQDNQTAVPDQAWFHFGPFQSI